jgi:hypothetical protein
MYLYLIKDGAESISCTLYFLTLKQVLSFLDHSSIRLFCAIVKTFLYVGDHFLQEKSASFHKMRKRIEKGQLVTVNGAISNTLPAHGHVHQ